MYLTDHEQLNYVYLDIICLVVFLFAGQAFTHRTTSSGCRSTLPVTRGCGTWWSISLTMERSSRPSRWMEPRLWSAPSRAHASMSSRCLLREAPKYRSKTRKVSYILHNARTWQIGHKLLNVLWIHKSIFLFWMFYLGKLGLPTVGVKIWRFSPNKDII